MEERHPAAPRLGRGEPPMHAGLSPTFCGQPARARRRRGSAAPTSPSSARRSTTASRTARARASGRGPSARPRTSATPGRGRTWSSASTRSPSCASSTTATSRRRPASLETSQANLRRALGEIYAAGAVSVVLGGDHSLSWPTLQALAERHGPDGYSVVHLDTHADTGAEHPRQHEQPRHAVLPRRDRGGDARREHRADRPARGLAVPRRVPVDARPGLPLAHDGRDRRARPRRRPRGRHRPRPLPRPADVPHRRHRRARPGLRARHRHARARRPDDARAAARGAPRRRRARPRARWTSSRCGRRTTTTVTAMAGHRVVLETLSGMALRRRG